MEPSKETMNTSENQAVIPATVLVVDDDPGARLLVGTALEMAGFRVVTAGGGANALSRFGEQPVDFVVLDGGMPGVNGFDAGRTLRKLPRFCHVRRLV